MRPTRRSVVVRHATAKSATTMAPTATAPARTRTRVDPSEPIRDASGPARAKAKNESCASASRTLSKRIEANSAEKGRPRSRASSAGRSTSPARAGSTVLAAKPIAVARNAGKNGTSPTGRRIQIQRVVRMTKTNRESATAASSQGVEIAAICRPMSARGTRDRKNASSPTPRAIEAIIWKVRERSGFFTFG